MGKVPNAVRVSCRIEREFSTNPACLRVVWQNGNKPPTLLLAHCAAWFSLTGSPPKLHSSGRVRLDDAVFASACESAVVFQFGGRDLLG